VHARSARMASAAAQVDAWGGCIRGGGLGGAVGGRTDATDGETDHNRHAWVHGCARGGRRRVWRELAGGLAARRCQRAVSRGRGPRAVWILGCGLGTLNLCVASAVAQPGSQTAATAFNFLQPLLWCGWLWRHGSCSRRRWDVLTLRMRLPYTSEGVGATSSGNVGSSSTRDEYRDSWWRRGLLPAAPVWRMQWRTINMDLRRTQGKTSWRRHYKGECCLQMPACVVVGHFRGLTRAPLTSDGWDELSSCFRLIRHFHADEQSDCTDSLLAEGKRYSYPEFRGDLFRAS